MRSKPRNPLVAAAKFRRAGAHDKTTKAKRRGEKTALVHLLKNNNCSGGDGVSLSAVLA